MEARKPLYLFDLDGTIAKIDHRRHYITGKDKNWTAFTMACVDDEPNMPVIRIMQMIRATTDMELWIFSGRSDIALYETHTWLHDHDVPFDKLIMREDGDYTEDHVLKERWYIFYGLEGLVKAVFDDRQTVVDMWRSHGLACFQVAEGNF